MKKNNPLSSGYWAAGASVTLLLLLLGSVAYILLNARGASLDLTSNIGYSIHLDDNITKDQLRAIDTKIRGERIIKSFTYISKDSAAVNFKNRTSVDFSKILDYNPLPASFELQINSDLTETSASGYVESLNSLASRIKQWDGVNEVDYNQAVAKKLSGSIDSLNYFLMSFGGLLLFISIVLLYNTLKLEIAAQRSVIQTMRLVGAEHSYIRRPFVLRALWQGAFAGLISAVGLYLLVDSLNIAFMEFNLVKDMSILGAIFSMQVIMGIVICTVFTSISVSNQLRSLK